MTTIDTTNLTPVLAPMLTEWLPEQRWFAGKGRGLRVESVHSLGTLGEVPHWSAVVLVGVTYDDGTRETFNVPISVRDQPVDELAHALIGVDDGQHYFDALQDKSVTDSWLRLLAEESTGDDGIRARLGPAVDVADLPVGLPSLVMTAEQSNTSLVFGDAAILKVFRRIEHGENPDIEVHAALGTQQGASVARLLGSFSASWPTTGSDGRAGPPAVGDIAMLQEFLRSATDGWSLAQISVRDLFAEGDLHADEVGGDFAAEAHRLGVATARTHAALAATLQTGTLAAPQLSDMSNAMRGRLAAAAHEVTELAPFEDALGAVFDRLADLDHDVPMQRIHGDLHLGQVLRTTYRWVMIDFEGEPSKPISERVALDSPIRDIAGMLRSFDYAARHHLVLHAGEPQIAYRAAEWVARNVDAYCAGYAEASGADPREQTILLAAYEADKAVYEVVYEARNRPTWLSIPLYAVERLASA